MTDKNKQSDTSPAAITENQPKFHALLAYAGLGLGLFFGLPWFVGGIWAIIKKEDAVDTVYFSHYKNAIMTFWWGLGISLVGLLLATVFVGYLVLIGVWIWSLYRVLKGVSKIMADKEY